MCNVFCRVEVANVFLPSTEAAVALCAAATTRWLCTARTVPRDLHGPRLINHTIGKCSILTEIIMLVPLRVRKSQDFLISVQEKKGNLKSQVFNVWSGKSKDVFMPDCCKKINRGFV